MSTFPTSLRHGRERCWVLVWALAALPACHAAGDGAPQAQAAVTAAAPVALMAPPPGTLSLAAQVGKELFFDKRLSATGAMSCATCHDPEHFHAPPNDLAVQKGGPQGTDDGTRAVPSLRYKEATPAYADLFDNPDGISAPGPGGGFAWDGRASTLAEQARLPLLSPIEMANVSAADIVAKVREASYAPLFQRAFPNGPLADGDKGFAQILAALQAYQLEDASFHPYTSKFDLHAGNKLGGELTAAETRGLKVFANPKQGNCAACHYLGAGLNGSSGMFTDFSYEAIGVPRNRAIAANGDPQHFDLGLGGPDRRDHLPGAPPNTFAGLFKTPTLRNIAQRHAFFHNGVIHSLEQALRFYNTRDTNPELWYPTRGGIVKAHPDRNFPRYGLITTQFVGGVVEKFDDLPARFRGNIDPQMPLDGRAPHGAPPLSEANIADLLCFLDTLTDGYRAAGHAADIRPLRELTPTCHPRSHDAHCPLDDEDPLPGRWAGLGGRRLPIQEGRRREQRFGRQLDRRNEHLPTTARRPVHRTRRLARRRHPGGPRRPHPRRRPDARARAAETGRVHGAAGCGEGDALPPDGAGQAAVHRSRDAPTGIAGEPAPRHHRFLRGTTEPGSDQARRAAAGRQRARPRRHHVHLRRRGARLDTRSRRPPRVPRRRSYRQRRSHRHLARGADPDLGRLGGERAAACQGGRGGHQDGGEDGGAAVSAVVRFRPELASWLVAGLDMGQAPAALVKTMIDERMSPAIAQAIVDAFVSARRADLAVPVDAITIDDEAPVYLREPSLLERGRGATAQIHADDAEVRILARGAGPNLALLGDVMTPAECQQLIDLARPRLEPSQVVDPQTGANVTASYRNSMGMFFRLEETPFIARLDRRLSAVMNFPRAHGEGLQVLCYGEGGMTAPHFDYLLPTNAANESSIARSGQRVSTLLVYLNQVAGGGETVFPHVGFMVTPQAGNGVYFESSNSLGQLDRQSFHAGRPVTKGEKWVVTKWMRQRPFVPAGAA